MVHLKTSVGSLSKQTIFDKLKIAGAAAGVFALSILIAAQTTNILAGSSYANLIAEAMLGIGLLVGGILVFGVRAMRLTISKVSIQNVYVVFIPLVGIILINAIGTPLSTLDLSRLQIGDVVVTGFWEEVFFRGFLLALWAYVFGLKTRLSRLSFLAFSSLLFGLVHTNEGMLLFLRTGLGFMFGVVVLQTETILFAVILHALNNSLAAILGGNTDYSIQLLGFLLLWTISIVVVLRGNKVA